MKQKVKDILREHVHQHEYSVDPEEIFVGALAKLQEEKKDKKRFLLAFFLFFGIAILFKLQTATLDTNYSYYDQLSAQTIELDSDQIEDIKTIVSPEQKIEAQVNSKNEKFNTVNTNDIVKSTEQKEISTNSQQTQQRKVNTQTNISVQNQLKSKETIQVVENKVNSNKEQINTIENTTSKIVHQSLPQLLAANKNLRKANEVLNQGSSTNSSEEVVDIASISLIDQINKLDIYNGSIFHVEERLMQDENSLNLQFTPVIDEISHSKFALSIVASYGLFQKDLVAKEEGYLDYAVMKSINEKELEVFSSKLLLTYMLSNNLNISIGAKYQQINEEFIWEGNYFVNELGEQIDISLDNLVAINFYQEVDREVVEYNRYQVLSIPVLIGLQKNIKRFSIGLKAGPLFQAYSSSVGKSLGLTSVPVSLDGLNTKFGLGWEGNVEVGYFLGKRIEVFSELSIQKLQSKEQYVTSNINSVSLGLGLRKSL